MNRSNVEHGTRVFVAVILSLFALGFMAAAGLADEDCSNMGVEWNRGDFIPLGLYDCATGDLIVEIDQAGVALSYGTGRFVCPVIYLQIPAHYEPCERKGWELTSVDDLRVWAYEVDCVRTFVLWIFPYDNGCRLGKRHGHGWIDNWHARPCDW